MRGDEDSRGFKRHLELVGEGFAARPDRQRRAVRFSLGANYDLHLTPAQTRRLHDAAAEAAKVLLHAYDEVTAKQLPVGFAIEITMSGRVVGYMRLYHEEQA